MLPIKPKRRVSERSPSSSPQRFQAIRTQRSSTSNDTPFTPAQFTPVEITAVPFTPYQMDTTVEEPENTTEESGSSDEEPNSRDPDSRPTESLSRFLEEIPDAYDAYELTDLFTFCFIEETKRIKKQPQFFSSNPMLASISRLTPSPEPEEFKSDQDRLLPRSP